MRKLKKLLAGICITAFCLTAVAMPASAKEMYNDIRDSYSETDVAGLYEYYSDDQIKDLYNICRVTDPDDWYLDDYIKDYANKYKEYYYVGDLRVLNQYDLAGIRIDENKTFNYGVFITDNYFKPSFYTYYCKCSDSDFETFKNYWNVDSYVDDASTEYYAFSTNHGKFIAYYYPEINVIGMHGIPYSE